MYIKVKKDMIYITIECRMYNCLDKTWALELHHGFTTQGQPWRLGHGLGHLLDNSRTCGGRRLAPGASPSCRRLSDEWMDWRSTEVEAIYRGARRSKGARTGLRTGQVDRPGSTSPGLFRPGSDPSRSPMLLGQLLTCSLLHVGP
jgi:hypothetical protein